MKGKKPKAKAPKPAAKPATKKSGGKPAKKPYSVFKTSY